MENKNYAIEVKNFTKKYKRNEKPAVDNINFKVKQGSFHGFIGANGAGKTTTIKSLIGAYANFKGKINFFGVQHNWPSSKKKIGYIPEKTTFPIGIKTITYLKWFGFLSGLSFKESKFRALRLLEEQGLLELANKKPNKFSSGQKKSIILIQALLHEPRILIMDEPAANLDPTARIIFFNQLKKLQKQGITIFISSHILSELEKYISSVTILDGGKVVYCSELNKNKNIFDENKYISSTPEKKEELFKILKDMELQPKPVKTGFNIIIPNEETKNNLLKKLMSENISFNSFIDNKNNLEEIYRKYVIIGSNHTQAIKLNKNKVKKMQKELW
ncbi:MAG: ABC transporter ATP-binding protein [Mycoplasma sp.]|nr:ABC transporter ATP-binding protein [Mycoplasma sp.]